MTELDFWKNNVVGWLDTKANDSDVVLASRVQLARNLCQYPFPGRANNSQLLAVDQALEPLIPMVEKLVAAPLIKLNLEELSRVKRNILCERQLVTAEFLESTPGRAVYTTGDTTLNILVNDEDHFKVQALTAGVDLATPLQQVMQIDDLIESQLDIAFAEKLGYLTANPKNLGTGLKVSALLHLPGLVLTDNISPIIEFAAKFGIRIRSAINEEIGNSDALLTFASQSTLGRSEAEIVDNFQEVLAETIEQERRARKALVLHMKDRLDDSVWRAYGTLANARLLTYKDALLLLSRLKLGMDLKLIKGISSDCYAKILFGIGNSFLQNLVDNENLSDDEIERLRAKYVRQILQAQRVHVEEDK